MFKEILNILPRLSNSELNKMERSLSQRFKKVAKGFGKGMARAFSGGALIAGIASILNPLKEVQEAIEKTLASSDDLVTFATQFGTTAGKLQKLEAFAGSAGLDSGGLYQALNKFQTSVAEATADPSKATAVRQFAGRTDTADAFFEFIQGLKKLDVNEQSLIQSEIFGEKAGLKMADFLQSDFAKLNQSLGQFDSEKQTKALEKLSALNDRKDLDTQVRNLQDTTDKARLIHGSTVSGIDQSERQKLRAENQRISRFATLNDLDQSLKKMQEDIEKLVTELPIFIEGIKTVSKGMQASIKGWALIFDMAKNSRLFKGLFGGDK